MCPKVFRHSRTNGALDTRSYLVSLSYGDDAFGEAKIILSFVMTRIIRDTKYNLFYLYVFNVIYSTQITSRGKFMNRNLVPIKYNRKTVDSPTFHVHRR